MHKAAKRHNQSAAGNASGEKTFRDQAQPKAKPSNTGPSPLDKVTSSGGLTFRCSSCDRSCRSREALEAHAKAKAHQLTITASIKRPEKAYFRCDVCSRCDFGSQTALNDHKCDSEGHQNRNQHSAPQEMLSNSQTRTDHRLPLSDGHSLALTVDKMVQCDLCSCKITENKTCESPLLATSYEGQNQQKMPLSNAKIHHALALGSMDYSGKAASCQSWETCTDSEECVIDAISQRTGLAKGNSDEVTLAIPSVLMSQLAITEDPRTLIPPNPQLSSKLIDVYGSVQPKPLEHLGKEWSAMSLYEQSFTLKVLRDLCHSVSDLERNGYRFRQYTFTELMGEQKCKTCKSTPLNSNVYADSLTPSREAGRYSTAEDPLQGQPREKIELRKFWGLQPTENFSLMIILASKSWSTCTTIRCKQAGRSSG